MLPGVFGSSVAQVSLLLDTQIATFLITGSVSWLYYADRLMEFPLGVFSIALATVILPGLSRHHADESKEHFTATLDWALRLVILLVSPAAVAMLVFAGPLTATTFGYGAFLPRDVQMASYALMAYSWGLLGFSLVKVLAPGYFARQDTRTPVRVGLIALGCNMALNVIVVLPAHYLGFPYPHILIATSTCIAAAINTTLLWRGLVRAGVYQPRPGWGVLLARVAVRERRDGRAADLARRRPLRLAGGIAAGTRRAPRHVRASRRGAAYFAALFVGGMRMRHMRNARAHDRHGIHTWNTGPEAPSSRSRHHGRQLRWHPSRARRVDRAGLRACGACRQACDHADLRTAAARIPGGPARRPRIRRPGSRACASAGACSRIRTSRPCACCASTRS